MEVWILVLLGGCILSMFGIALNVSQIQMALAPFKSFSLSGVIEKK